MPAPLPPFYGAVRGGRQQRIERSEVGPPGQFDTLANDELERTHEDNRGLISRA